MYTRYDTTPNPRGDGSEMDVIPCQKMGVPLFSNQYRYFEAVTPGAGLLAQPTDAIVASAAANVTLMGADDPGGASVTIAVLAGVVYPFAASRITAVSAGTVTALYHVKPSNP